MSKPAFQLFCFAPETDETINRVVSYLLTRPKMRTRPSVPLMLNRSEPIVHAGTNDVEG